MNFLKGVILVFIFFVANFFANAAYCDNVSLLDKNQSSIQIINANVTDNISEEKNKKFNLNAFNQNSNIIAQRKGDRPQGTDNNFINPIIKQFQNLIKYRYNQSYLCHKSSSLLELLLFQIQPNAP